MQIFKKIDRKNNQAFFIWKFAAFFLGQAVLYISSGREVIFAPAGFLYL